MVVGEWNKAIAAYRHRTSGLGKLSIITEELLELAWLFHKKGNKFTLIEFKLHKKRSIYKILEYFEK